MMECSMCSGTGMIDTAAHEPMKLACPECLGHEHAEALEQITSRLQLYTEALVKRDIPWRVFTGMTREEYDAYVTESAEHLLSQGLPEGDPDSWLPPLILPCPSKYPECLICNTHHVEAIAGSGDEVAGLVACNRALERRVTSQESCWKALREVVAGSSITAETSEMLGQFMDELRAASERGY